MTDTTFVIQSSTGRGPSQRQGRFEYRVWPGSPHVAVSRLHRFWPLTDAERRSDIYFVHSTSNWTLPKLRSGRRFEIKRRHSDVGTVQHWSMPVSTAFPLTASQLGKFAAALGLRGRLPAVAGLSAAHLVAELGAFDPSVFPQSVQKSRLIFRRGCCRAEICRVTIAGWRGLTVALEASDFLSIATAIDDLHLGTLPNRSYGDALMRFGSPRARQRKLLTPT